MQGASFGNKNLTIMFKREIRLLSLARVGQMLSMKNFITTVL